MFSRPEAEETESDLLRFQEEFLAGHLNPSAVVVRSNTHEGSPCAGDKRDSSCEAQVKRDVVALEGTFCVEFTVTFLSLYLAMVYA